jgi:hypothetical protein
MLFLLVMFAILPTASLALPTASAKPATNLLYFPAVLVSVLFVMFLTAPAVMSPMSVKHVSSITLSLSVQTIKLFASSVLFPTVFLAQLLMSALAVRQVM